MKPKVLIAPAPLKEIEAVYAPQLRAAGLEVVFPARTAQMSEADLLDQLPGCSASLAGSEPYTRKVIEIAAKAGLKVIARAGVGYDAVDLAAATEHGVAVCFAPGTNQDAVAEHALMLVLALSKSLILQHEQVKLGHWPRRMYEPIRGRTLGIVGMGRTGKAVAERAAAFNMNLIGSDPVWDDTFAAKHRVKRVELDELFSTSDIVTLHVPHTPITRKMINARTLGLMKPTAFLVNTARGPVIDEAALYEALAAKRIAGAGLDVFVDEPPLGSPLLTLNNVVVTAHTAGVDAQSLRDMARVAAESIAALMTGEWPADRIVNADVKTVWKRSPG